jgi:hypothetical protein
MATLGNELVVFGGGNSAGVLKDTWVFKDTSWTQVSVANPPSARSAAAMAALP